MTSRRPRPAVTIDDIRAAHERIAAGIARTPCPPSIPLSDLTGFRIWCKLDLMQRTGSFKERGARNALELLDADAQSRGVIAASAGNHALGLAWHGRLLEIPVTVDEQALALAVLRLSELEKTVVEGAAAAALAATFGDE